MTIGYVIRCSDSRACAVVPGLTEIDVQNRVMRGDIVVDGVNPESTYFFASNSGLKLDVGDVLPSGYENIWEQYVKKPSPNDLQQELENLKQENAALKTENDTLKSRVSDVEMTLTETLFS